MNCVAALLDVVNCFAFTSVGMTVTTNVMLKIGDIMQQVCLREIYEPVGDAAIRNPWSKRKVPGGLRIFSDGTGMVCDVASYWKETEPGAIVMGISGGVSMASLGLALAIGKNIFARSNSMHVQTDTDNPSSRKSFRA